MNLHPSKIDVAVLLIFFVRVEKTEEVFNEIRKARPSKLFLYQDGPRAERKDDMQKIEACRKIVEQIDWDCEVFRYYQDKNFGCDPSEYIAQKWMFSHVDKGIILEDDDVPSQSFFPFCKELLDKYEHDYRINIICGMNNLGSTSSNASYIFTRYGSIWGWATWKRNVDLWDKDFKWMNDEETVKSLKIKYPNFKQLIRVCKYHISTGRDHYESILGAHQWLNHQLNIVPTQNMITNIGIGADTTHSCDDINKLPKATRKLLYQPRHEIDFPIIHPDYVVEDMGFKRKFEKLCRPNKFVWFLRRIEGFIYRNFPFTRNLF